MVITKEIYMKWNSYNMKFYNDLGYKYTKMCDDFVVKIEDLNKNSHYKVKVKCDMCDEEREMEYKSYNNCLKKHDFYACSACRNSKTKITVKNKYNVDNVFQRDDIVEIVKKYQNENVDELLQKRTKTNLKLYGVENPYQRKDIIEKITIKTRKTKIDNGLIIPDYKFTKFQLYKKKVMKITYRNKKILFEKWDGYDYYDNDYIKDNFIYEPQNGNYPTMDHKISIRHGFDNGYSEDYIGSLDNLCITKKSINTSKYIRTEDEYKK